MIYADTAAIPAAHVFVTAQLNLNMPEMWAHYTLGDLSANYESIERLRVNGASVWVANDTAELFKSGSVLGIQVSKSTDWWNSYAAEAPGGPCELYNRIYSDPRAKTFPLANGIYGFLKPAGAEDFEYVDEYRPGFADQTEEWRFNLRNNSDYLAVVASTGPTNASQAISLRLTIIHAVEFQTNNSWLSVKTPEISPDSFQEGIMALLGVDQWYENPLHWEKILGYISKVAKIGAPVLSAFGPYGAVAAEVAMAVAGGADAAKALVVAKRAKAQLQN